MLVGTGARRNASLPQSPLSFTSWVGKRATNSGRLPQTATIPSLVCSREMLHVAFLDLARLAVLIRAS